MGGKGTQVLTDARDVVVVGAGPAGSVTAAALAGRGHDVLVLEEHPVVGEPVHCTGLLGLDAFDEFDLPRDLILGRATGARFWGAAGQSVPIASHRAQATIIDRARLDAVLAARAVQHGAELRLAQRVERVVPDASGVTVTVRGAGAPIRARSCVLACGAHYGLQRSLGIAPPSTFLLSAQIETRFPASSEIEVRFGRQVAPSGFAWLVPFFRDGVPYARAGLMSETRSGERFGAFVASLAERAGTDPRDLPRPRLKMLPLGPVARTYADRIVLVGDAAGLVKPTTGGGIYYGLLSGRMAADVLDDALGHDRLRARNLRGYESQWRRRLGHEIRVALAFRRLVAGLNDESIDALIDLAQVNGVVPLLQETASFNWHRKAAVALLAHPAFRRIVLDSWVRAAAGSA